MRNEGHHGELGDVLHGLIARALRRHVRRDSTSWIGLFAMFNGGLSRALMALGALATGEPLVSPSLEPTAFMAGATTLIVSLGIVPRPTQLVALFAAIVVLVLQGLVINRLAGVPYPRWAPRANGSSTAPGTDEGGNPTRAA